MTIKLLSTVMVQCRHHTLRRRPLLTPATLINNLGLQYNNHNYNPRSSPPKHFKGCSRPWEIYHTRPLIFTVYSTKENKILHIIATSHHGLVSMRLREAFYISKMPECCRAAGYIRAQTTPSPNCLVE
ncbi:hypothetical protein FOYG_01431 [Fusarium oxysporum NRRL 32931]|uniref:Uncharacterized protein n=1 Tax=Fusarium oxysporum NRRL 32931 TaxID=660029 RepID=W9JBE5_FUSOX|nr:hypothetical protein FOYG_01431 [Fusarium oxysporum NRRL 32931]